MAEMALLWSRQRPPRFKSSTSGVAANSMENEPPAEPPMTAGWAGSIPHREDSLRMKRMVDLQS